MKAPAVIIVGEVVRLRERLKCLSKVSRASKTRVGIRVRDGLLKEIDMSS